MNWPRHNRLSVISSHARCMFNGQAYQTFVIKMFAFELTSAGGSLVLCVFVKLYFKTSIYSRIPIFRASEGNQHWLEKSGIKLQSSSGGRISMENLHWFEWSGVSKNRGLDVIKLLQQVKNFQQSSTLQQFLLQILEILVTSIINLNDMFASRVRWCNIQCPTPRAVIYVLVKRSGVSKFN